MLPIRLRIRESNTRHPSPRAGNGHARPLGSKLAQQFVGRKGSLRRSRNRRSAGRVAVAGGGGRRELNTRTGVRSCQGRHGGCHGGEVKTPHLEALAANGLRFTSFYNSLRCSPSRASFLSGQYPHRLNAPSLGRDPGRNGLTIAQALSEAGYGTAMAGRSRRGTVAISTVDYLARTITLAEPLTWSSGDGVSLPYRG
ncbi:MAG: sulfatase-like hydrolase/transferase, partial [Polyangiaceae bacterium]|nr:sulfatase-like hydrolase/transferase [Polyangiaceae bacterium]